MQVIETPTCYISKYSGMGKVLRSCQLVIWEECTMAHKKSLEALNRRLKNLRGNEQLFGGALILLAGDFRQTLPVIPRSAPADELNTNIYIIVQLQQDESSERFAKQLLDIGNGKIEMDESTYCITLPENFCHIVKSTDELSAKVFPNVSQNYKNNQWVSERAILAAKNIDVNLINSTIQNEVPDEETTYKSIDTVVNHDESVNYPIEFFNSLDLQGMPPHILSLKIGSPIILLGNINPPRLCNGTRLSVKKLMNNIIEATILKGKHQGEHVLLSRIPIIPTDTPFDFKRLQFPVRLAFVMTINKVQGQSLQVCGLNWINPCFSHGQLYVGCSRVGKPSNLFILASDRKTNNVVYLQALLRYQYCLFVQMQQRVNGYN
ncbi:ATP-dependent DNA helicase Pif1-like [Xylocopa sonorina]|uniref:ATP-dependent DNA helicase Pif1-like n=1 Tax=Xylocopa sonorina TaxID=1818115 RepID=UPI00403AF1A7